MHVFGKRHWRSLLPQKEVLGAQPQLVAEVVEIKGLGLVALVTSLTPIQKTFFRFSVAVFSRSLT
jgi:hypothetical protein